MTMGDPPDAETRGKLKAAPDQPPHEVGCINRDARHVTIHWHEASIDQRPGAEAVAARTAGRARERRRPSPRSH